ncbi:MAG: nucleoside deaminase [Chlamydiota bacterium]
MQEALLEAKKAFAEDEVPVGAVAVFQGKIIARAYNRVESLQDASAHAELLCLRGAALILGNWRLLEVTLYTTLEPCTLCAGALLSFRVKRLVWGAPDIRQGADGSWVSLLSISHPMHKLEVTKGVLPELSTQLMKEFFLKKRDKKNGENV